MKKAVVLILSAVLLIAVLLCGQITDTRELQFTAKCANCESYALPLSKEEYARMETFDIYFDAQFSKRLFGQAKMEGKVTYEGKTYQIRECQPYTNGWCLVLWHEDDPAVRCSYLTMNSDFNQFYLMYRETLWFGPAGTYEALVESLNAFEKNY